MPDVVVVGGGVIGLSIARELAGQGAGVRLLEQGRCGREASWAGAGILPPGNPEAARSPECLLRSHSHVLWSHLSAALREETGIDNGYRRCGGLQVDVRKSWRSLSDERDAWGREGVEAELVSGTALRELEPALADDVAEACFLPQMAQVRNPRHGKALAASCRGRGVEVHEGEPAVDVEQHGDRIVAVRTPLGRHEADAFCFAGGAWTAPLLARVGVDVPIVPVRGQIVLLNTGTSVCRRVVECGPRYLVPRPDGRTLVGATEEWVGFDRRTTAEAVAELIAFATNLVPALKSAEVERSWAGLRPGSHDRLPYLGHVPGTSNLFVAAGHFRAGLQTSPATARLLTDVILGREPLFPLDAFRCDRAEHGQTPTA